nr:hypothetical protein [Streptococcus sp. X16XC17]
MSYPPVIEPNSQSNHMVSHSDIYRTIADLLEVDLSDTEAEDSVSNLPLWQGMVAFLFVVVFGN